MLKKLHKVLGLDQKQSNLARLNTLRNYSKSQLQLVKVFGAIFAVSILSVIPVTVLGIIQLMFKVDVPPLYPIAYISLLSKSVLHPILESYLTYETRDVISKFCSVCVRRCKLCHCRKNLNEAHPSLGIEVEKLNFDDKRTGLGIPSSKFIPARMEVMDNLSVK